MMKRLFVLLLALIMVSISVYAAADDVYSTPILFKKIPWGTSYTDAVKQLGNISMRDIRETEYWHTMDDFMYTEGGFSDYNAKIGGYAYASSSSLEGEKVAGYDIDDLYMYFVYVPGDDGLLIRDEDHTALIYAYYKINPKDLTAAYEDLTAKLTKLYGDVDGTQSDSFLITDNQNLWNGAEGTMVSLVSRDYESTGTKEIYIKYGFSGAEALMQKAYDAIALEESINAADNTDGL